MVLDVNSIKYDVWFFGARYIRAMGELEVDCCIFCWEGLESRCRSGVDYGIKQNPIIVSRIGIKTVDGKDCCKVRIAIDVYGRGACAGP